MNALRRFKPYPAYKDSGIEWLGKIPAQWDAKPLKHLTAFTTGWTPPTGREDLYAGEHLWANISDLGPKVLAATEKHISDRAIREARLQIVRPGALLFSFKLSVGTVSIVGADMYTNEAIAAFAPSPLVDTQYLYWAAPVFVPRNAQENIYGAPLLNRQRIAGATILSPPIPEQRAIAAFLDRETARLDALVAKKERLIELLQEKRTALITRAVTKGLDPTVPMKDSGVEWLGEIPAHWEVKKVKRLFRQAKRLGHHDLTVLSVYRDFGVIEKTSRDDNFNRTPEDLDVYQLVSSGDLVINKMKAWQGSLGVSSHSGITSPDYVVYSPRHAEDGRFLHHFLRNKVLANVYLTMSNGIRPSQWRLEPARFEDLPIFIPPLVEQERVATFLHGETKRIDALVAQVRDAIDRLKELRTALISAAVTGKIDVHAA